MNEIQKICLDIQKDIDRVCKKYEIAYSLCGGSVIGALLYEGFIPWDDDIDLMMTRENYDRFLKIYPKKASAAYHLRHFRTDGVDNLPALFARVEDTRTSFTEEIAGSIRKGHVFVDITVFDTVPGKLYHHLAHQYAGFVYTYLYRKNGMTPGTKWKKTLFKVLPALPDESKILKKYKRLDRFLAGTSGKKAKYRAELLSAAYAGILYESRIFDNYIRIPFEDEQFMIVEKYMDYLFMRYGRREFTKTIPEEERQHPHLRTEDRV